MWSEPTETRPTEEKKDLGFNKLQLSFHSMAAQTSASNTILLGVIHLLASAHGGQ